jgi:hypothetical protein
VTADQRYFCPTSGDVEHPTHGGFDVCCGHPELHRPITPAEALPADEHHYDTSCDDRPYCEIPQHHALEDMP